MQIVIIRSYYSSYEDNTLERHKIGITSGSEMRGSDFQEYIGYLIELQMKE